MHPRRARGDLHRRGCLHFHHVPLLREAARLHVAHGWLWRYSRTRRLPAAQQPGSLPRAR